MKNSFAFRRDSKKQKRYGAVVSIIAGIFFGCLFFAVCLCFFQNGEKRERMEATDGYVCDIDFSYEEKSPSRLSRLSGDTPARTRRAERVESDTFLSEAMQADSGETDMSGFVMQNGASIRLNIVTGIRFRAELPAALAESVKADGNKTFGFVIAPEYYFRKAIELDSSQEGGCDYVRALAELEKYGAKPALRLTCEAVEEAGGWIVQASVANILYVNTNLSYTAAAYIREEFSSGDVTYTYAKYETDCLEMSRSVSYVATAALNDERAGYSPEQKTVLEKFVYRSADLAAGISESETGKQDVRVRLSFLTEPKEILLKGESFEASVEAEAAYADGSAFALRTLPVFWSSSAPGVISVSSCGKLTALSEGSAMVSAAFGRTEIFFEAVCGEEKLYFCEIAVSGGIDDFLEITPGKQSVAAGGLFETEIRVKEYESCGEFSFWIGGKLYTTEEGIARFSAEITQPAVFTVENLSSALSYFQISESKISIKNDTNIRKNLPVKLILPAVGRDGTTLLTTIEAYTFNSRTGNVSCVNLREITLPESYKSVPADLFRNCSALETIWLKNTALATSEISGTPNWNGCEALKCIYVPQEAAESYKAHKLWGVEKNGEKLIQTCSF